MKNFVRKSFAAAILALPLLGHAGIDCGSHKVLNVYQGGDHGTILVAVAKTDGICKYLY
jgi:hypothetical protein